MSRLGGFDIFEVSPLGEGGVYAIRGQVGGVGISCGRVKLYSEEGE